MTTIDNAEYRAPKKWVCRHGFTISEDCQECLADDSDLNRYPNGWSHVPDA